MTSGPTIRLRVLGRLQIDVDDRPVSLSPRAIGVVLRLGLAGGPVSRQQILMDLWGDDASPDRVRSLETIVSNIRRVTTGRGAIVLNADRYHLTIPIVIDCAKVLSAAKAINDYQNLDPARLATAAVLAKQGEPALHSVGSSTWLDELESSLRAARTTVLTAAQTATVPELKYVDVNGLHLAYQFHAGSGTPVLLLPGLATHCEGIWQAPGFTTWVDAAFGDRPLILYDKRGTGLSDSLGQPPSDQDLAADAIAVLNACEVEQCVVVACAEAGMFGPHIAAAKPETVQRMIFVNATPKMFASDGFPHGLPERLAREFGTAVRESWARDDVGLELAAPSVAFDPTFAQWAARYQKLCASPGGIWHLAQYTATGDGRLPLQSLTCPTLVLQSRDSSYFRPSNASWIAETTGTTPTWLDSADHMFWLADPPRAIQAISEFLADL